MADKGHAFVDIAVAVDDGTGENSLALGKKSCAFECYGIYVTR